MSKKKRSAEEQVKLYLIEKAESGLGKGAVSRLVEEWYGMEMYFYPDPRQGNDEAVATAHALFHEGVFDAQHTVGSADTGLRKCRYGGIPEERMLCLEVRGSLTDLLAAIKKNDPAMLEQALKSHGAAEILRREQAAQKTKGGI